MKGYRFYEDFGSPICKRRNLTTGNCIAVFLAEDGQPQWFLSSGRVVYTCASPVYCESDSTVCTNGVSPLYLMDACKRVSERRAGEIHPKLIAYLSQPD